MRTRKICVTLAVLGGPAAFVAFNVGATKVGLVLLVVVLVSIVVARRCGSRSYLSSVRKQF